MNQRLFSYPDPEVLREGSFLDDVSLVGEVHQQGRENVISHLAEVFFSNTRPSYEPTTVFLP
jgi:hypothetical protein